MAKRSRTLDENGFPKFGMRDKLAYAAGDFGCNMSFALASYLAVFYTQYIGLSASLFALLLIILKVWDAVNDPLIGALMDGSKKTHKRGKFKSYIFVGSFGLVVAAALCFIPIPNAALWLKIAVCMLGYMAWDLFYTVVNVPYGSMVSVITAEPGERAQLSAWRNVGALVAGMGIGVVLPMIIYDENDNLMGGMMFPIALILGVVAFLSFRFLLRGTTERIRPEILLAEEKEKDREQFNYFRTIGNFLRNRGAMGVTLAVVAFFLGNYGAQTAVTVMFQSYFHNAGVSGVVMLIGYIPMFAVMPFIAKIVRKWGKKEAAQITMLLPILSSALMLVVPIGGDAAGMLLYLLFSLVNGLGMSVFMVTSYAMLADAIDYNQWKTGRREEGTIYAFHSFFRKIAQGVGPSIGLLIMEALGYVGTLGANQAAQTALNMRYMVAAMALFSAAAAWACVRFIFNIDKKSLAEMEAALGRSNAALMGKQIAE